MLQPPLTPRWGTPRHPPGAKRQQRLAPARQLPIPLPRGCCRSATGPEIPWGGWALVLHAAVEQGDVLVAQGNDQQGAGQEATDVGPPGHPWGSGHDVEQLDHQPHQQY